MPTLRNRSTMRTADPLSIGDYNYNLGTKQKTELQALYRQLKAVYDMPALKTYYSREELISFIISHPRIGRFFKNIGQPTHANKGAVRLCAITDNVILSDTVRDLTEETSETLLTEDEDFVESDSGAESDATYEDSGSDEESEDYSEDDCSGESDMDYDSE